VTETSEFRSGIPLLMDVPIIGKLFRVTRETTIQRDLMILVTPTIVRGNRD
jgi:type II secretory pathway component GspD/PulD (secretin)